MKQDRVIVVSGLPRSGTSLMMQMLHAGGIECVTDGQRAADDDNPRGYFELEQIKQVAAIRDICNQSRGKAIKIIHALLKHLPTDLPFDVLFMRRDLAEVVASQQKMLERSGRPGANLPASQLQNIFAKQLDQVHAWLASQPNIRTLYIKHAQLFADGDAVCRQIIAHLQHPLDKQAMRNVIDPLLYRQRHDSVKGMSQVR